MTDWEKVYEDSCDVFARRGIPEYMVGGLARYVVYGIQPGDFLTALFENDFMEAACRADDVNLLRLHEYAILFYNDIPIGCRGSKEKVKEWVKLGGLKGLEETKRP